MVGEHDERPRPKRSVDRATGVREHEACDPEPSEDAHAEDDLRRGNALVQMGTALHHCDRDPAEPPENERARMPDGRRRRPARNLAVRKLDDVLDRVREPAEAAAEHHADLRAQRASGSDRTERVVDVVQAVPSARRLPSIDVTHVTASSGSSVKRSSSRSPGETSPSASISARIQSSISTQ